MQTGQVIEMIESQLNANSTLLSAAPNAAVGPSPGIRNVWEDTLNQSIYSRTASDGTNAQRSV